MDIHWRGHAFLFDRRPPITYDARAGTRLLLIFAVLEGVIGPRLSILPWLHLPEPPSWVRIPGLLLFALALVRYVAGVRFADVGFARWKAWSAVEKSYFVQLIVIANVVFVVMLWDRLHEIVNGPAFARHLFTIMLPYVLWGLYQELIYRGILQTELVRRWGAVRGILVSSLLFTFGPLHFYHFARGMDSVPTFAAIFATGLFFGTLFHRCGNLWIVGITHGIGNAYMDGTARH